MTNKTEVIQLHKAWPQWNTKRLAATLKCSEGYINACRVRYGLDIPKVKNRKSTIYNLGKAALAAGLTVEDIVAMGVVK